MEEIGRKRNAVLLVIYRVTNPSFWEKMDYTRFDIKGYYKF